MLGMSQETVEKNPEKYQIFKALKTWETAREAGVFNDNHKERFKNTSDKFKLEQTSSNSWILYTQKTGNGKWIAEKLKRKQ